MIRALVVALCVLHWSAIAAPDEAFEKRVSAAVDRGVEWLRKQQKKDGSFAERSDPRRFGKSSLVALTLVHCGASRKDPTLRRAVAYLRRDYSSCCRGDGFQKSATYSLSLFVMTLDALYTGTDAKRGRPPPWAGKAVRSVVDWLVSQRREGDLFGYPTAPVWEPGEELPFQGFDLSNTQFAVLALWSAKRCGYKLRSGLLEKIGELLLASQQRDGPKVRRKQDPSSYTSEAPLDRARGFGYLSMRGGGPDPTGSMTAGGLSSLLLIKAMLMQSRELTPAFAAKLDRGIWDAIAWLNENYSVRGNPGGGPGGRWHRYYLYSLERACTIARRERLGKHDWYAEGAEVLLDAQTKAGAWEPDGALNGPESGGSGRLVDTCFALLFLRRASPRPARPVLPQKPITKGERGDK